LRTPGYDSYEAALAVASGVFREVILAIDHAGSFSRFPSLRVADELPGPVDAGHFEGEENVVRLFNFTPCTDEPETGIPVRCLVGGEDGFPAREVRDSIATEHVDHLPSCL